MIKIKKTLRNFLDRIFNKSYFCIYRNFINFFKNRKVYLSYNEKKYILKDLLSDFLPKSIIHRPKMGFAIPIERWIENKKFKNTLDEIFHESCWNQFGWDKKKILNKWLDYKKYGSSTPQSIWMYAMAGFWLKRR